MLSLNCTEKRDESSSLSKFTISVPIPIPKTQSSDNMIVLEEYSLKCNTFNPSKMSPPDSWKCRLQQRLKLHYLNQECKE